MEQSPASVQDDGTFRELTLARFASALATVSAARSEGTSPPRHKPVKNTRKEMKTHKDCKIEAVTSRDATRATLSVPYLRGGCLWATDGRAMVKLPVESDETDTEGFVPVEALKAARKLSGRIDSISVHLNGAATLANGATFPRPTTQTQGFTTWPNCERVFDDAIGKETKFSVALDVKLLAAIADAMGTDKVRLQMTDENTAIRVYPGSDAPNVNARGILMPIRTL